MVNPPLIIENYNNDFLLIKAEESIDLSNAGKAIFNSQFYFVDEVIVSEVEICVKLNDRFEEADLKDLHNLPKSINEKIINYKLPIYFDNHEDWLQVEKHVGLTRKSIIDKLLKTKFSVSMFGFLPGFIYMDGLDTALHIPRKTVPSKYVKANSIALGGKYLGIYAVDSPGGWHVIGRIPIPILDLSSLPPVEMNLGDVIRLESIDEPTYQSLLSQPVSIHTYNT